MNKGKKKHGSSTLSTQRVEQLWRFVLAWTADPRLLAPSKDWQVSAQLAVCHDQLPTPKELGEPHDSGEKVPKFDIWGRFCKDLAGVHHVGDWLRWLALLRVVMEHIAPKAKTAAVQKDVWLNGLSYHFSDFRESSKTYGSPPSPALRELLEKYNLLPIRRGCAPLSYPELIEREAPLGSDPVRAVQDFHDWLLAGSLPLHVTPKPSSATAAISHVRDVADEAVARLLSVTADASPVVNICCRDLDWAAPVVDHVVASLAQRSPKPFDGLLVARQAVVVIAARTAALPDGKPGRMLAPADALAEIARAFQISVQVETLRQSDRAFRNTLNQVRRACTLFSGILIFTGLDVFRGRHSTLLALMRGRRWPAFIRALIQIDWQTALDYRMENPTGAKVLVVSNAPIDSLDRWCGAPLFLAAPPAPSRAGWLKRLNAEASGLPGTPSKDELLRLVMLAFCACSPDGISYGSLRRGVGHWLDLTDRVSDDPRAQRADNAMSPDDKALFAGLVRGQCVEERVAELLRRFPEDLLLSIDEPLPWIHEPRVQYEWRANAGTAAFPEPESTDKRFDTNAKLHFRDESRRRQFISEVLTGASPPPAGWSHGVVLGDRLWRLANLAIAIEALTQATGQMLSFSGREPHKLDGVRRMVQTIYHLRAAGDLVITAERGGLEEYAAYLSVPKNPVKRFRYAYAFCYKRMVEGGGDYRMARSYARHDIKLAIVALFLAEDVRSLEHDDIHDAGTFVGALDAGYARWIAGTELPGHDLVPDIIASLAFAAVEAGDVVVANWALGKLEESRDQILSAPALVWGGAIQDSRRLVDRWRDGIGSDLAKLRFDLLDSTGQKDAALTHCRNALIELGMPPEFLNIDSSPPAPALNESGGDPAPALVRPGWIAEAVDTYFRGLTKTSVDLRIHQLEKLLGEALDRHIAARHGNRRQRSISDLLARYGDILATHADHRDRDTQGLERLRGLLEAFGALWLADRIRSHCAGKSGFGVNWAMVSAKPNRVYVRTSLAVARALSKMVEAHQKELAGGTAGPAMLDGLRAAARDFMSHAAHRRDVYVRHLHPHRREALHGLLLSTSVARTWHAVAGPLGMKTQQGQTGQEIALCSLEEAEGILLELGVPLEVARRIWVERISLFIRGAKDSARAGDERRFKTLSALIERDLTAAYRLAETVPPTAEGIPPHVREGVAAFWGPLVDRQWNRWRDMDKRVQARL